MRKKQVIKEQKEDIWKPGNQHTVRERSMRDIDFQMTLPEINLFDDKIEFKFKYHRKPGKEGEAILRACKIVDAFDDTYEVEMTERLLGKGHQILYVGIPVKQKNFFSSKMQVSFLYLCSHGKKVVIHYYYERKDKPVLKQVEQSELTKIEAKFFSDHIIETQSIATKIEHEPKQTSSEVPVQIKEYIWALKEEIKFLKNDGGKKYKITNGVRLSTGSRGTNYLFEMESELYIADSSPIKLEVRADANTRTTVKGSVISCEDFHIMVVLEKDIGERVSKANLNVEPWKLLDKQIEFMEKLDPQKHTIANKLIEQGPGLATREPITKIKKGQNEAKKQVIRQPISLIWGPPGTGKTHVMAEIAIGYLKHGKRILVVSHSNVSIDGVVKKIASMLEEHGEGSILQKGNVLRYGYIRDPEVAEHTYASSFQYTLHHSKSMKSKLEGLVDEKIKIQRSNKKREMVEIEKQIHDLRTQIRHAEKGYVESAQLVGTTISKVMMDPLFEDKQYDIVMFDEVSMAYTTQIISAATYAKEKLLCVGDFLQLPPIAQCETAKKVLETDIFHYLGIVTMSDQLFYHPWLVMLDEQRRMHPEIAKFVNQNVYHGLLKDHESVKRRKQTIQKEPFKGHAINAIDLSGTYCAAAKNNDNSRFNILSAIISFGTAIASENNKQDVGIITPYAAQTRLIRAMIQDHKMKQNTNLTCATVHQFQGSESDVIIFDAVESEPLPRVGWLLLKEMHSITRLINVAVTRARGKFINIYNERFWLRELQRKPGHIYYQLCHYLQTKNVISYKNNKLKSYIENLNLGQNLVLYKNQKDSIVAFKKDIQKAKERIIVSIPDGNLVSDTEIFGLLQEARKKGIEVWIKTEDYVHLPEEWKGLSEASDNAVFPLIAIDKKVIWYGLPDAKRTFQVKNMSYQTPYQTILRIQGEKTIDMIYSLTDLETRTVGSNKKTFEHTTKNHGGLAKYIMTKEFCPECKSHFELTRGRSNKPYLKCSNPACKKTKFLDIKLVRYYIDYYNVRCPKEGGEISVHIGDKGIYISCECGHYLKVEEI